MTQIERLIARLVQLVEDNPGQMIVITVAVDNSGIPICWQVAQTRAEGLKNEPPGRLVAGDSPGFARQK